ncbi:MAG: hypothetical protein A2Y03_04185 [Omnitrophica WOR_2 bacterium GWF2_38_59]|nr:MAG: hypothetical protein A2Y03_04185 [Omnitrophica WOR_2 bacterium GWF2_38_59]OGX50195.1 MAG: hypothetical protein A2243_08665 [Omnitrophica WOR_2 bacterium RIFOXYA2_FULL_38_17]OGX52821.1 MAG: hypothetical protein A2267_07690 [Omnitrophica WOR_2 bacterium RIFOXYA12_FULL_38_10]OGX57437.1 MAG: hypothetical protein A2306_02915 [Omnitrophica WOR_2 bacterium RIFOXYB2_FULL_38_16]OGX57507.1 MAG: hypothetical protein A2447_03485 [Omnitrophica WOR_2 bacterium RIFOXYC2_FULL_38_12]
MINPKNSSFQSADFFKLIIKGFCIGIANAIPGISGGTIAFILGLYEDLISSIKLIDTKFLRLLFSFKIKEAIDYIPWKFLGSVVFGAMLAIVSFAKIITWLLHEKPILINSFFFGLIIATIPIIGRIITKWTFSKIVSLLLAALLTYGLSKLVPMDTPEASWFIFLCGIIAISTMILPGISGSFVLVLLGKYFYILEAVNDRNFAVLSIFALGACIGLLVFVRILSWLFNKYHDITISALTGIVIGSLSKVWPWKETIKFVTSHSGKIVPIEQVSILPKTIDLELIFAIVLMITGIISALILSSSSEEKPVKA